MFNLVYYLYIFIIVNDVYIQNSLKAHVRGQRGSGVRLSRITNNLETGSHSLEVIQIEIQKQKTDCMTYRRGSSVCDER